MNSLCCTSCLRLGGRTAFRAWYRLPPPEWEACASYVEGNSPRRRTVDHRGKERRNVQSAEVPLMRFRKALLSDVEFSEISLRREA